MQGSSNDKKICCKSSYYKKTTGRRSWTAQSYKRPLKQLFAKSLFNEQLQKNAVNKPLLRNRKTGNGMKVYHKHKI